MNELLHSFISRHIIDGGGSYNSHLPPVIDVGGTLHTHTISTPTHFVKCTGQARQRGAKLPILPIRYISEFEDSKLEKYKPAADIIS